LFDRFIVEARVYAETQNRVREVASAGN